MQQTEKRTKGTVIVNQLSAIHRLEQKQGIRNSRKGEEDIQNYIQMKLLLRRFDFDLPENYEKEVYEYIIKNHISDCMLVYLVTKNMFHRQKVVTRLIHMFEQANDRKRADYYQRILAGIRKKEGVENE